MSAEVIQLKPAQIEAPKRYRVIAKRNGVDTTIGTVFFRKMCSGEGWVYSPLYQAGRSRKLWESADAAVKGRVSNYRLEAGA